MSAGRRADVAESGRGQGTRPSELVVHPRSGEVLGDAQTLEHLPGETLAEALLALDDEAKRLREMRKLLDAELVRRLDVRGRSTMLVGDFELHLSKGRESVWDADELELVLTRLVGEGVLEASELVGVINRETTVSRSKAGRLIDRLGAQQRRDVEACRTWQQKGSRKLEVVRSAPLLPE